MALANCVLLESTALPLDLLSATSVDVEENPILPRPTVYSARLVSILLVADSVSLALSINILPTLVLALASSVELVLK